MKEFVIRGYEVGEATAVAEVLNAIAEHTGYPPWAVPAAVESYVTTSVRDPALDSRLVLTEWNAQATAPAADEDTARLFRRKGLAAARYWFDMTAATAPAHVETLPPLDGLRTIGYVPAYEPALHAAHMEAFAGTWGFRYQELADWVPRSVGSKTFLPELSRIALDGDEIAGYVLCQRGTDPARFYVDYVGVRPAWRRRGVASGLLAEVLRAGGEAGMTGARLMVDADSPTGAVGVYQRAGFAVESQAVTYTAPLAVPR